MLIYRIGRGIITTCMLIHLEDKGIVVPKLTVLKLSHCSRHVIFVAATLQFLDVFALSHYK